jgi:hypothetical protein
MRRAKKVNKDGLAKKGENLARRLLYVITSRAECADRTGGTGKKKGEK